jgi:hypothetical protein
LRTTFSEVNSYSTIKIRICLIALVVGRRLGAAIKATYKLRYIQQGIDDEFWLLLQ